MDKQTAFEISKGLNTQATPKVKGAFKLYEDLFSNEDRYQHIANPTHLFALCGQNTYGFPEVHPEGARNICPTCQARHDNRPNAWTNQ